uniref:Reverse transcriptase domain-containing protein n=1 Tax=Fagus sylvatica TaxID=28930 RepID=A0A2N9J3X5_FAGSY
MMCNGEFLQKDPDEAIEYLIHLAEKAHTWTGPSAIESTNRSRPHTSTSSSGGIYQLKEEDGLKAQIAQLTKEIETLKMRGTSGTKQGYQVEVHEECSVCHDPEHPTKDCPMLPSVKEQEKSSDNVDLPTTSEPLTRPISVPFPQALKASRKLDSSPEILENLRQVRINLPLLHVIKQVPSYAKILKDLCTMKRKHNVKKTAFLTEQVSALIQHNTPPKYKDPGCPTISCIIGDHDIEQALLDLGASVNLMPYLVYLQLGLGEIKPTMVVLQLANRSVKRPRGVVEDVLVQIDKFYYPVDFLILDTESVVHANSKIPIILVNIFNIGKQLVEDDECEVANWVDVVVEDQFHNTYFSDPLESCIVMEISGWRPRFEELPKSELKPLPSSIEIPKLEVEATPKLVKLLKKHKTAIGWTIADIKGISPLVCTHKLNFEEEVKTSREPQRRLNPNMKEVVKSEVLKLLDAGIIYPIADSKWVSPTQVVPKKSGVTVVENELGELVPTKLVTGWRMCIDYRKLNAATRKDHFPLPFIDQVLERVAGHSFYCFLDGYSGYYQIEIDLEDQDKTTFTCPFGTYAFRRMPFGLCNASATFQRCMMSIFSDMVGEFMEVFMDDLSVFGDSFDGCLENLGKVLARCEEKNLVLNWEKCHFMVTSGIVLGHIVSSRGIEEFSLTIKDKKGVENVVADHLSRLTFEDNSDHLPINDEFPDEHLFVISKLSWYAHIVNYLVVGEIPKEWSAQDKRKFLVEVCPLTDLFLVNLATCRIELEHKAYWAIKAFNFDLDEAGKLRKLQLNELEELRNDTYESSKIYKAKMKNFRDKRILRKTFEVNQKVYLYDSRLHKHPGKLRSRWDGPYVVKRVFENGAIEVEDPRDGRIFKVNGQRLKPALDRFVPEEETISLEDPVYRDE